MRTADCANHLARASDRHQYVHFAQPPLDCRRVQRGIAESRLGIELPIRFERLMQTSQHALGIAVGCTADCEIGRHATLLYDSRTNGFHPSLEFTADASNHAARSV